MVVKIKRFFLSFVLVVLVAVTSSAALASDVYSISEDTDLTAGIQLLSIVDPVTPDKVNGFKQVMLDLIGDYEATIVEYSYENNNGYTSYIREVQPDYVWLCSCAIFLVVLYCVFRLGAAILCRK